MYGFADKLRSKGRFGDSLVAHLSEAEARLLKKRGGSGTTNPFTGAVEFYKGAAEGEQANNPKSSFFQSLASIDANEREEGTRLDGFYNNIQSLYDKNRAGGSATSKTETVNPTAIAVANILKNTRYVYNDKENLYQYMYFSDDGADPYSDKTWRELDEKLQKGGLNGIRRRLIGSGTNNDTDEDMVPRDMSRFLRAIGPGGRSGNLKRGGPLVSQEDLFKAYEQIGVTPYDIEGKTNTGSFSGDGYMTYKSVDGTPVSIAQEEVTGVARNIYNNLGGTSLGPDGSPTAIDAGSFDSFSAFADAAFAPASWNQGSFNNLFGSIGKVTREGVMSWGWQQLKNYFNSPTKNADGNPFANKIDSDTHAGDAPGTNYRSENYNQYGDFGYSGGTSGTTNSYTGLGSTSF